MMWQDWLNQAILHLSTFDNPKYDAESILEQVTGSSRFDFLMSHTQLLNKKEVNQANILLMRRIQGEPIAYLTGICEFWSLKLNISSKVFIPRVDTECLVEQILLNFSSLSSLNVLDLGSGSGAIALAIASERPKWKVTGVDFLLETVNLARKNATLLKIKNVRFLLGNWFYGLKKGSYDIIVSNPPYISINDPHLLFGDVRFEPKTALVSKEQGLADLSYICHHSNKYLNLGGWLILEHGWLQGKDVRRLFLLSGFRCITTLCDYNNNERVTYGQFV